MRQWIAEGRVNAQTLIQAEGQTDWRPLSSFPEFSTVAQPMPSGVPLSSMPMPGGDAQAMVSGPATGLMVVGILCVLASLIGVISNLFGGSGPTPEELPPQLRAYFQTMSGPLGVVMNLVALALGGFFIFASRKMKRLESYGMVMTATILSMLPCTSSCCCVGLPVGIWILIVLAKPEVKSAFR
jgi:hypothetical protein